MVTKFVVLEGIHLEIARPPTLFLCHLAAGSVFLCNVSLGNLSSACYSNTIPFIVSGLKLTDIH